MPLSDQRYTWPIRVVLAEKPYVARDLARVLDEDAFKVASYIGPTGYHPPVLLDTGGKVAKQFHVNGIPKSFVFDREGKLVAQSIDMRTQHQFLMMLGQAGLHP